MLSLSFSIFSHFLHSHSNMFPSWKLVALSHVRTPDVDVLLGDTTP